MTRHVRRTACISILFFSCSFAIVLIANLRVAYGSSSEARVRGSDLFLTSGCVRCHSITGVGGKRAPDLGSVGRRRDAHQIRNQILHGGHGMPPFGGVLTHDEVQDLVAFLTSCRTSKAPGCRQFATTQPAQ